MARASSSQDLKSVLDAAKTWIERSLIGDLSVFTEERIWTLTNVEELKRAFVDNLDEGEGSFNEKLERQLKQSAPPAKRLMAEMRWILGLFPTTAGPETKREEVVRAWSFSGEHLPEGHRLLSDAVLSGIGSAGTAYNTHRWRELRYLIFLLLDLKVRAYDARQQIFGSYDNFMNWIESVPRDGSRQFRHILRYFAFPDQVERISSNREKRRILCGFGLDEAALNKMGDTALDAEIAKIRKRLENEHPDKILDFYEPPIRQLWDKAPAVEESAEPYAKSPRVWLMGTGPDGRMWKEFREGSFIALDSDGLGDLLNFPTPEHMFKALAARKAPGEPEPVNDAKACWQFSREVAVGDLVIAKEGQYRLYGIGRVTGGYQHLAGLPYGDRLPVIWMKVGEWRSSEHLPQKSLTEVTKPKFRQALEESMGGFDTPFAAEARVQPTPLGAPSATVEYSVADALEELFIAPDKLDDILKQLRRKKNLVLQGPPGVGKTFAARRIAYALLGAKDDSRIEMVQFHPNSSYEDFVYGWRPNGNGGFSPTPGVFYRFVELAKTHPESKFVFIIDEINRGNLSKILGELMMLIEADKRGPRFGLRLAHGTDDADRFHLPENIYLIGTMNTADRSLALVDYALRRRFAFVTLEPNFGERFKEDLRARNCPDGLVEIICKRVAALNEEIVKDTRSLGTGYQVGHSYFCSNEKISDFDGWYRDIVTAEIEPLLLEYWMDDPKKAKTEVAKLLAD